MAISLLQRQVSLLEYLTSAACIYGPESDAPSNAVLQGLDDTLLRLEAGFCHQKRMDKIALVFPLTFKLLGDYLHPMVGTFADAHPPLSIARLDNARQFYAFLRACCPHDPKLPSYLVDVAACELAWTRASFGSATLEVGRNEAPPLAVRRHPDAGLLRVTYDIRSVFEGESATCVPIKKNTQLGVAIPAGGTHPQIFEVAPPVFNLLLALEGWCDLTTAAPELNDVVRDLVASGLLQENYGRICIIGKFPPIQGGVSMRTFWIAHGLAALGHAVHVVTNAKEVRAPLRMHMRREDWARCEEANGAGSVIVRWTDPVDASQAYVPAASPFVTKLAATAASAHANHPFDVIYSHYMEPYGIAGHLAAEITGVPHVTRMAGSDAGRLWRHPQFEQLYDHVLRSAEMLLVAGTDAASFIGERAIRRGVAPDRIVFGGPFAVPEEFFTPAGPVLDILKLRDAVAQDSEVRDGIWGGCAGDRPHFGIYGKLGEEKGSFVLLDALHRLKLGGIAIGLVALAHGNAAVEQQFRSRARELGLYDDILQIPFLPHWRVPEFLRGCLGVCCLEQRFPIGFHAPIIPREVLLCGTCLIGSTEVIRKLPGHGRLPSGYGCVAIEDVNDVAALAEKLATIAADPGRAAAVGERGRAFAQKLQRGASLPQTLSRALEAAATRQRMPAALRWSAGHTPVTTDDRLLPLRRLVAQCMERAHERALSDTAIDLSVARTVLAEAEQRLSKGETGLESVVWALRTETAIAKAEHEADETSPCEETDPLFRVRTCDWAIGVGDFGMLVPFRDPRLRVVKFDYDVSAFIGMQAAATLPSPMPARRASYVVVFGHSRVGRRDPLVVDELTAAILQLSDGTRTAMEIANALHGDTGEADFAANLAWIEKVFVSGLLWLRQGGINPSTGRSLTISGKTGGWSDAA